MPDDFGIAPHIGDDNGHSSGHRFHQCEGSGLADAGQHKHIRGFEKLGYIQANSEKVNSSFDAQRQGESLEFPTKRTIADHQQIDVRAIGRHGREATEQRGLILDTMMTGDVRDVAPSRIQTEFLLLESRVVGRSISSNFDSVLDDFDPPTGEPIDIAQGPRAEFAATIHRIRKTIQDDSVRRSA